jgi:hypothetical protein
VHVNEFHGINIYDILCYFLVISPIIVEYSSCKRHVLARGMPSCCEIKIYYSSHKSQGIFNYLKHITISRIIIYLSKKTH